MPEDESPADVVEEVTEKQEDALPEHPAEHTPPPWAEQLIAAVESIPDKIAEMMPNPVNPEVGAEEHGEEDSGFGEDESPESRPWTHRGFGKG